MVKRILISLLLVGGVLITASFVVRAQVDEIAPYATAPEIKDLNNKIKNKETELKRLKDSVKAYQDKLDTSKTQSRSITSQLEFLDNQITKMGLDIQTSQAAIDKSKLEISSLELQIDKENEEVDSQKSGLEGFIKLINKEDQRSTLEVLLTNNSFSEFFNQLQHVTEIQADLKKSIDRLILLTTSLETQKADLENFKKDAESLKADLEDKQSKLQDQLLVKESLLTDTQHNEYKYQKLISESDQVQDDVASSIGSIKDEVKNRIAKLKEQRAQKGNMPLMWPVDNTRGISATFHDPDYPFRYLFEHPAIDIRAYQGTPVRAAADGYVARAKDNGYGYSYITLIHDNNIATVYGHVSKIYVVADQYVHQGDIIGLSGATPGTKGAGPFTTGPHLHFEVRVDGIPVDPLKYLPF